MAVFKMEHIGIMVNRLEESIDFYRRVVGLKHKETIAIRNGDVRLGFLGFGKAGEAEVELIEGSGNDFPTEGRVHHLAFTVDDIEAEYARIKEMDGIRGLDPGIKSLPNGSRYFFFDGPDGERIEFFQTTRS